MAKKKAPAPWSMNVNTAKAAAKKSIAETSKVDPKTTKTGRPLGPRRGEGQSTDWHRCQGLGEEDCRHGR